MQWQHSLGVVSVKANFPRGRKELSVSLFQAAVLMLFDGMGEGDKITFQEIRERTGIELGELKRTMQSTPAEDANHPNGAFGQFFSIYLP